MRGLVGGPAPGTSIDVHVHNSSTGLEDPDRVRLIAADVEADDLVDAEGLVHGLGGTAGFDIDGAQGLDKVGQDTIELEQSRLGETEALEDLGKEFKMNGGLGHAL